MGNYKFRLSDMIPNAWFYKLKDMSSKTRNNAKTQNPRKKNQTPTTQTQQTEYHPQYFSKPRHSYYFTTDPLKAEKLYTSLQNPKSNDTQFPPLNPPRKSTKRRRRSTRICRTNIKTLSPRISTRISTTTLNSTPENPSSHFESPSIDDLNNLYEFLLPELETNPHSVSDPFESLSSWSSSCSCRISSSATDIIIDMNADDSFSRKLEKLNGFDLIPELELPPILTKPRKFNDMVSDIKKKESKPVQFQQTGSLSVQIVNGGKSKSTVTEQKMGMGNSNRRSFSSSSRIRIKSNSPKIPTKKVQSYSRKMTSKKNSRSCKEQSVSESCAIVKFSFDPQRDFRESMEEMILENNIRTSKDLEELLACYLTLNSNEYHDIIVKVFEQIWFDLTDFKL